MTKPDRANEIYQDLSRAAEAVQRLGIVSNNEYRRRYREDPGLPAHPYRFYADEWVGWKEFFGTGFTNYKELSEAKEAACRLGIRDQAEYGNAYKKDPRLPRHPQRKYRTAWITWDAFLDVDTQEYATYPEAKEAAIRLCCLSKESYRKQYKNDPKLPSHPHVTYYREWESWKEYLGILSKYPTYEEASISARKMNIKTQEEYFKRYKEDPRLPRNLARQYPGVYNGIKEFLGTGSSNYRSIDEAKSAVRALGIDNISEYYHKRKLDSKLPSAPFRSFANEWVSWSDFLGKKPSPQKYENLKQAAQAAQNLGITSQSQYHKHYKKDLCLPSSPSALYSADWVSWYHFLNKFPQIYYSTLDEASSAARKLGIKSTREYARLRKRDPMLPWRPNTFYANEWKGSKAFFGTEFLAYKTLAEAKVAAKSLKIDSVKSYIRKYKQDPLLPSVPSKIYANEWKGWNEFLDINQKYRTLISAKRAALKLGIKTQSEYQKRYREDPMLYSNPMLHEPDKWEGFLRFLSKSHFTSIKMNNCWQVQKSTFLTSQRNIDKKDIAITKFYNYFAQNSLIPKEPLDFVKRDYFFDETVYRGFMDSLLDTNRKSFHTILIEFFNWIITEQESEETRKTKLKNHLLFALKGYSGFTQRNRHTQSVRPVLPLYIVEKAREFLFPCSIQSLKDCSHLLDLYPNEWHQISEEQIDRSDNNCVWRRTKRHRDKNSIYEIWSPVKAIALYTLLKVPLRGQQILWLDSGESDKYVPIINRKNDIEWVENRNHLVSYRRDKAHKGFLKPLSDNQTGMYINTNKTSINQDGYSVPYIPLELAKVIIILRQWQEKYNPLSRLTSWEEIKTPNKINQKLLRRRGEQSFLFRRFGESQTSTKSVFSYYLPRLLYQIQESNDQLVTLDGRHYLSRYTPHAIRTSLITAYAESGLPLQVISKLVGHKSMVMTVYYYIASHFNMKKQFEKAEKVALVDGVERMNDQILDNKIEDSKGELIFSQALIKNEINNAWPSSSYQITDRGICPMGGSGCDSGGVNEEGYPTGSSVPVGYLGKRNCPRCKYFITGPKFIGGLASLCNEILLEIRIIASEQKELEKKLEHLKNLQYDAELLGQEFPKRSDLRTTQALFEDKTTKLDVFTSDFAATQLLIKDSQKLLSDSGGSNKLQLLTNNAISLFDVKLEQCDSDFRLLCEICENAEIFKSASASRALPKRSLALDRLASENGFEPIMFKLNEEEQLAIGNQAVALIKAQVKSWINVEAVVAGKALLEDFKKDTESEDYTARLRTLFHSANVKLLEGQNDN